MKQNITYIKMIKIMYKMLIFNIHIKKKCYANPRKTVKFVVAMFILNFILMLKSAFLP